MRAGNVTGRGRADGAVNFNQPHLGRVRRRAQKQSRHYNETPTLHNFST